MFVWKQQYWLYRLVYFMLTFSIKYVGLEAKKVMINHLENIVKQLVSKVWIIFADFFLWKQTVLTDIFQKEIWLRNKIIWWLSFLRSFFLQSEIVPTIHVCIDNLCTRYIFIWSMKRSVYCNKYLLHIFITWYCMLLMFESRQNFHWDNMF